MNFGLVALDGAPITIGDDVQIQGRRPAADIDPSPRAQPRRAKWERSQPITIAGNVWLGGGATVLPGVAIGANGVVEAGAVVTHDQPANVVAVGNPARVIRRLGDQA